MASDHPLQKAILNESPRLPVWPVAWFLHCTALHLHLLTADVCVCSALLQKYREKDVKVARKDGLMLVRDMTVELKNMMDAKMHAVLVS